MLVIKIALLTLVLSAWASPGSLAQDADGGALSAGSPSNANSNHFTTTETEAALRQAERLTVVASKLLRPQSDYNVLVSLANSQAPATVDLQLTGAADSNREQVEAKSILIQSGETQLVKFTLADWPPAEYLLSARALAVDRSWNFSQEAQLTYQAKSFSGFIQTDKPIYKPSDLVRFRALFLSGELLVPLPLKQEINVTVSDPKRNVVRRWQELSNWRGLLTLELALSDDPQLGDWLVEVEARGQQFSKSFRVAEYVLPTFEVSIQLPSYATHQEPDVVATVRAEYTYGRPVRGHVTLSVQPLVRFSQLDTRPLDQAQFRARLGPDGSVDFPIDLIKDLHQKRDLFERELEFFALVEEDLTGRKYNATKTIKVHDKDIKVELLEAARTFKPGLRYHIRLKVAYQDDTPVEDNGPELELEWTYDGSARRAGSLRARPTGGLVERSIEVPHKVDSPLAPGERQLTPRSLEFTVHFRGQTHRLSPVFSALTESEQFVQIELPQFDDDASGEQPVGSSPVARRAPATRRPNVNDQLKVRIVATEPMQQVTCQGLARNQVVWAVSREAKNETRLEFEVNIEQRMAPRSRLLCFYVRPENKELMVDARELQLAGGAAPSRNPVKLSASRDQAKPGQEVEVGVFTKPNSLVGVLAVDQSVLLLRSGNDLSRPEVERELASFGEGAEDFGAYMDAASLFDAAQVVVLTNNLLFDGRRMRQGRLLYAPMEQLVRYSSSVPGSNNIRLDRLLLQTDLPAPEFHLGERKAEPLVLRSNFAETWLWQNSTAGPDGQAKFSAKLPDTITSWQVSAFSLNEAHGLGLATSRALLTVFKPFFIKLNLPYSLIRGETVSIQAVVSNYSKRPLRAKLTLDNSRREFEFVEAANSLDGERPMNRSAESRSLAIGAQEGVSASFLIRPKRLGHIDIKMVAQSDQGQVDGLVRKLLVKAEGQAQHLNKAILINLSPGSGPERMRRNVTVEIPANAVPDSRRLTVSLLGDLLGAGLTNIDDLLRLPYGCGEQNMINLVPNIVLLNYLLRTGRLKEAQRARALRNIETGYQRQLNYKRPDGSFSAFGSADPNGSVWLTAYVLKSLQQARSVISVDPEVLRQAAGFIVAQARPDGSIGEVGMLHNRLLASEANERRPGLYLTAYSLGALLEGPLGQIEGLGGAVERAAGYLERQLEELAAEGSTAYELAAIVRALQVAGSSRAEAAYEQLWRRIRRDASGSEAHWSPGPGSSGSSEGPTSESEVSELGDELATLRAAAGSTSTTVPPLKPLLVKDKQSAHLFLPEALAVEMSALGLLASVRRGELERALPVVRWLIGQQNSRGGFASTQDTVLAIEALAAFAEASNAAQSQAAGSPNIDLDVVFARPGGQRSPVRGQTSSEQLLVRPANALVQQQLRLPENTTWVLLEATGAGSAVVQVSYSYNLLVSAEKPAFYLNPVVDKASNANYLQLSVCTYYKGPGPESNMALAEVELPSGFVADAEALPGLLRSQRRVKRVDTAEGETRVLVYLDKVTRDQEVCFTVPAHRSSKVSNNRPVPVTIYDYYDRKRAARIFYEPRQASSCDICEPDTCSEQCSRGAFLRQQAGRLLALPHEQRQAALGHQQRSGQPPAGDATNATDSVHRKPPQLLPLAPVVWTLAAALSSLSE